MEQTTADQSTTRSMAQLRRAGPPWGGSHGQHAAAAAWSAQDAATHATRWAKNLGALASCRIQAGCLYF
jgi:hypothetical protein